MLVKVKGTFVGFTTGTGTVEYPQSYRDGAKIAGGAFRFKVVGGEIKAEDGVADLIVLGAEIGSPTPPVLRLNVVPAQPNRSFTVDFAPIPNAPDEGANVVDIGIPGAEVEIVLPADEIISIVQAKNAALDAAMKAAFATALIAPALEVLDGALRTGKTVIPTPPGGSGTYSQLNIDTSRMSLRFGVYETAATDDGSNYMQGRNPEDRAFIGLYTESFGRGNLTYGPYSFANGHNCATYGAASFAGGAGSATGNPYDLDQNLNDGIHPAHGYDAFAYGKECLAYAAKCAAIGEVCRTFARGGFSVGYYSQAGDENGQDIGSVAAGYRARATGTRNGIGGQVVGSNLWGRGGSSVRGSGLSDDSPYTTPVTTINGVSTPKFADVTVHAGYVVQAAVLQNNGEVYVGHGTDQPGARHDFRIKDQESIDVFLMAGGGSSGRIRLMGLDNNNLPMKLGHIEFTNENGGSAVSRIRISLGGTPDNDLVINPDGTIEVANGVRTGGTGLTVNNVRVVGGQQNPIPHVDPASPNGVAINRILSVFEAHGLTGVPT